MFGAVCVCVCMVRGRISECDELIGFACAVVVVRTIMPIVWDCVLERNLCMGVSRASVFNLYA